ncbi:MAG: hypothetical protein IJW09_01110 [Clostridia bacterium]|nr:hypothetical protein [Clostridia bacterium]
MQQSKSFYYLSPHPSSTKSLTKTILPPSPAARGGYMARDAQKNYMFFSQALFEERHGKGGPGGNVRADFLWYFLCSATKKVHQNTNRERAQQCERPAAQ